MAVEIDGRTGLLSIAGGAFAWLRACAYGESGASFSPDDSTERTEDQLRPVHPAPLRCGIVVPTRDPHGPAARPGGTSREPTVHSTRAGIRILLDLTDTWAVRQEASHSLTHAPRSTIWW